MKKLIFCLLLPINIFATEPTIDEISDRYYCMKYLLDNADLYAMSPRMMDWLTGYCAGLKYAIDGQVYMIEGPR